MTSAALKIIGWAVAVFVVVGLVLPLGNFRSTSVCDLCGAKLASRRYQVPMTSITLGRHDTITPSVLSSVLATRGIITNCSHRFLFATGSGNGVTCAIGDGRHILPAVESTTVAGLVANLADFTSQAEARLVVTNLLQGKVSTHVPTILANSGFPASGFTDRDRFFAWWADSKKTFRNVDSTPGSIVAPK